MKDEDYMKLAIELAKKGCGWTTPNPMVGAVIVKDNKVIGQGYHQQYGQPHAEPNAIASCSENPKGATMYVTLEPCCHYGKQPPCVNAIIEAGISRVVTGSDDPNPLVNGKGIGILESHGIKVEKNILKQQCDDLNQVFFHLIKTKHPYVVMKYAMTLDGKIAAYTGKSKWITGEEARAHVQEQRHKYTAIMVGVGTVLADDPMLTCRIPNGNNPIRLICDTHLKTPLTAQIVKTAKQVPTILITCCTDKDKTTPYEQLGCQLMYVKEDKGQVDLIDAMEKIGQKGIDSILLEGGGTLHWSALKSGIVQKIQAYIAPKLFGGETAKTPVEGIGVTDPNKGFHLGNTSVIHLGQDFLIEGQVIPYVYRDC